MADVPLLDELAELLGEDPASESTEADRAWAEQVRQAEEALEILTGSAVQDIEDDLDPEVLMAYDVVDAESLARRHSAESDLTVADRAGADRSWAFGHVIVDEAQELSTMAWRALMRRSPNRWMTLVGDVAQTSSPAGIDSWEEALSRMWTTGGCCVSSRSTTDAGHRPPSPRRCSPRSIPRRSPRPGAVGTSGGMGEPDAGSVTDTVIRITEVAGARRGGAG